MGSITRNNAVLIIYVVLALLMYLGIYAKNEAPLLTGIGLFLVFTSYFLTWDLITSIVLRALKISYEVILARQSVILSITAASPLRLKIPAHVSLICSPHLLCNDDYYVVINGPQEQFNVRARWFGIAEILSIIIRISDPLGIIGNSRFIKIERTIPIEPSKWVLLAMGGQKMPGDYMRSITLMESRLGDFMYLRGYNFLEPASNIHWITSARVNDLISVARSEAGNVPRLVIMEYTPRMLKPLNDNRPIDEALVYLSYLKGLNFILVLIGNGLVRLLTITSSTSLADLELKLREIVIGMENTQELINRATSILGKYVKEVSTDELALFLYPVKTNYGLSREDVNIISKYLNKNSLLLITKASFNELIKANIDLSDVNVIVLGE
ncbi:hypothetical protein VMUT_0684 [Vulcanisaeta moutnovskia 768-28]|uniref:Uncharacterized protein n=1 Tax=Vulcanisaeta moutnovskia (strain 768-28) TaxID=985053 RepID=F0QVP2_VULM7|nr:DUF58 domain-containing protein [Vulcanisaeta moutnovskia]ADY00895.1 hypothetical protein VMUT_0684 [Vulcanisaeta moutnovskia 768-28]